MAGEGLPITVEVAYALPARQLLLSLQVPPGTTARAAVRLSGIADAFDGLDPATADLGVFGRKVKGDHVLRPGDRVEIYRPLIADPKAARRSRAAGSEEKKQR
ncbi:MAG: RnfH family protein [Pseudomonadota bacterium]